MKILRFELNTYNVLIALAVLFFGGAILFWSGLTLIDAVTGYQEAQIRSGHYLDKNFFGYVQQRIDSKEIQLEAIPNDAALPAQSIASTQNFDAAFFQERGAHARNFKIEGIYLFRSGNSAVIYRGQPEEGKALLAAARDNALTPLTYDPSNGTGSVGYDLLPLVQKVPTNRTNSHE